MSKLPSIPTTIPVIECIAVFMNRFFAGLL
jgi:hypothetical protein